MTSMESRRQLEELVEAWDLNEALLNQTDIDAIKSILKENKALCDGIINDHHLITRLYETLEFIREYCEHGIKTYITDDGFVAEVLNDILILTRRF